MSNSEIIILVGLPGSGKSTYAKKNFPNYHIISQDEFGGNRGQFFEAFREALTNNENIVIDRCNHLISARKELAALAKIAGYTNIRIVHIHAQKGVCIQRLLKRTDHGTISTKSDAVGIVGTFYNSFQRPSLDEEIPYETIIDKTPEFTVLDLTQETRPILVVGDIHGCFDELLELEERAKIAGYGPDVLVVSVGDLVDKGPKNLAVLQHFMEGLENKTHACVQGNHENRLRRWLIGNPVKLNWGLDITAAEFENINEEGRQVAAEWIEKLPTVILLPRNLVVVHGGFNPKRPLYEQREETMIYARYFGGKNNADSSGNPWFNVPAHPSWEGKTVVFGHWIGEDYAGTSQGAKRAPKHQDSHLALVPATGYPTKGGIQILSLDTGAVEGGFLSGLLIPPYELPEYEVLRVPVIAPYHMPAEPDSPLTSLYELEKTGLLSSSETIDPSGRKLILFNYTQACTFQRAWTPDAIRSRGTIYDKATGEIVAKAFPKFFNLGENERSQAENLPFDQPFDVYEKMDGSLGNVYPVTEADGKPGWRVATRGSFQSVQSVEATNILQNYDTQMIPEGVSLMVEIIYPENRIQVQYGDRRELVLLGGYDNSTPGQPELTWDELDELAGLIGMPLCRRLPSTDLTTLLEKQKTGKWDKDEGWVCKLANGTRIKIKTEEYMRIAKVKMNLGPLVLWERILESKIWEFMVALPEELRPEAETMLAGLTEQIDSLLAVIDASEVELNLNGIDRNDKTQRKVVALAIQKKPEWQHGPLFQLFQGKREEAYKLVVKMVRPKNGVLLTKEELP